MERVAYKVGNGVLIPDEFEAQAQMRKLTFGAVVDVEIFQRRSMKTNNLLHLIFKRIGESQQIRVRNVRGWIMILSGRADIVDLFGHKLAVPWGSGPGDMSADEFTVFVDDAKKIIADEIIPNLQPHDAEEVKEMLGRLL